MFTIMGATGHTGKRIARTLLEAGTNVRALARTRSKLAELEALGAEIVSGDALDATFLARAFRGSDGVYTMFPPTPTARDHRNVQDAHGEAIVRAVRDSGVPYVVMLSSIGAQVPAGTGPIAALHAQEERLRRLPDINLLILRPAYFLENFYETIGLIKHQGINGGAIAADLRMPMIATRDIADVAAQALPRRDWRGVVVRELLGERDLTHAEVTRILGTRVGKADLQYVQFPYDDYARSLVQVGLSESIANLYAEMSRAINEGIVDSVEGRTPENTTPTSVEAFADEWAEAYKSV